MGKGLTMPDRLEFLWQYHMNKIPDASKKVEGAKPESKTVPINRVNNEIKDYLFRFPNFISTTLDHLDQADQPLKTPNVVVDIPKLMVVDQASMLRIMMLTQCPCGSGWPAIKTHFPKAMDPFKGWINLACDECFNEDKKNARPLHQENSMGQSSTEFNIVCAQELSGLKKAGVTRFLEYLFGIESLNLKQKITQLVTKQKCLVLEQRAAVSMTSALKKYLERGIFEGLLKMCMDTGYGRAERTGANNGANECVNFAIDPETGHIILGVMGLKSVINGMLNAVSKARNESEDEMTSKNMDTEVQKVLYKFINDILAFVSDGKDGEPIVLDIYTDKANKSTGGLFKEALVDVDFSWFWCLWHECKNIAKMLRHILSYDGTDSTVTYTNDRLLNKNAILGLLLEHDCISHEHAKTIDVEGARVLFKALSKKVRFAFETRFKTPKMAEDYFKMTLDQRETFKQAMGTVVSVQSQIQPRTKPKTCGGGAGHIS